MRRKLAEAKAAAARDVEGARAEAAQLLAALRKEQLAELEKVRAAEGAADEAALAACRSDSRGDEEELRARARRNAGRAVALIEEAIVPRGNP